MRILLLNQYWFREELRSAGHTVVSCGASPDHDVVISEPLLTLPEVYNLVGLEPDAIVVYDNSFPLFFRGIEDFDGSLLYYAVDVHHHIARQRHLSLVFDEVLVSQKSFVPQFVEGVGDVLWFPLWATHDVSPSVDKHYDCVFVGTIDRRLNPERFTFFEALKELVPLTTLMGEHWNIFPSSRVVVNQSVRGELNFRVFEAMASGSPLVTEFPVDGMHDLFDEGVHFLGYPRGDVEEAARQITRLLSDASLRSNIGGAARERILASHLPVHRASHILSRISRGSPLRSTPRRCAPLVLNFVELALYFETEGQKFAGAALEEALRIAHKVVARCEPLDVELAQHLLQLCAHLERVGRSKEAKSLISSLQVTYPQVFSFA